MDHKNPPVLEVFVKTDPAKTVRLDNGLGRVTMIPFAGTVRGESFNGIVEPCGVDTQVTNANGVRHMSARYMLTGTDRNGQLCRIYVENEGWFTQDPLPKPFRTIPTFMTDSKCLGPYLHQNRFVGEGAQDETGLCIRFYELEEV